MDPKTPLRLLLLTSLLAAAAGQDWTDDQLIEHGKGFQTELLAARLQTIGELLPDRAALFSALVARVHGDHREYLLKVDRLLDELADERWQTREAAERTLIEIGSRARTLIEQRRQQPRVLEQGFRCARILEALNQKSPDQEARELKLMRGLVATALYLDPDPRLLRALRSALGHTDASVVEAAIRALGKHGGDTEAEAIEQQMAWKGGAYRLPCAAALGRMRGDKAIAICRKLLGGTALSRTEQIVVLRALHARADATAQGLLRELAASADPVLGPAARLHVDPAAATTPARFKLPDKDQPLREAGFGGLLGDSVCVHEGFAGLPVAELGFTDCDLIDFPAHAAAPAPGARVFLNQGSLLAGEIAAIDPEAVRLRSARFGELVLPRRDVQGLAIDPALDRLVGASADHDRVRLRSGEFVDGTVFAAGADALRVKTADGAERTIPLAEVAGVLFPRPRAPEPDPTVYQRLDLTSGERLIGFVVSSSGTQLGLVLPQVGAAAIPLAAVMRLELGVGGGAQWGFTLIADYSDNRVVEVDDQGREVFVLEEVFGAWDAECLDNGNLLVTEFAVCRVQELDRKGMQVWVFEDLKNPYDADRLPNGNTLIADTFGSRVIEVNRKGEVVWKYDKDVRPFDCDRLPNGNTLICNVLRDEVLEVSPAGEIVWRLDKLPNVHDADRLPNGNTLVTLRLKGLVQELDREGKVVWELGGLNSPSDADRLPNGHTLVAENTQVREFDRRGNELWKKAMNWAVEANRY